jgi:serine/threonine protein kinase
MCAYMFNLLGRRMDGCVDSFGVLLFEMMCGRLPFLGNDPTELVHCHIATRPPSPESVIQLLTFCLLTHHLLTLFINEWYDMICTVVMAME